MMGTTHEATYRRLRLLLDCILILLVILIASGNKLGVRAEIRQPSAPASRMMAFDQAGEPSSAAGEQPSPALIDNNMLAAMIAAENAALTPPQYLSSLPLINH